MQESVNTGQTDAGQSDLYVPLCFAGDTKMISESHVQKIIKTEWFKWDMYLWNTMASVFFFCIIVKVISSSLMSFEVFHW